MTSGTLFLLIVGGLGAVASASLSYLAWLRPERYVALADRYLRSPFQRNRTAYGTLWAGRILYPLILIFALRVLLNALGWW